MINKNIIRVKGDSKNKGEWSEFYTFLKILVDRKLFPADKNLKPQQELAVPVLKVFRTEVIGDEKIYDLSSSPNSVSLFLGNKKNPIIINTNSISPKITGIFSKIVSGELNDQNRTELMKILHCNHFRATPAGSKEDISMEIHDQQTGQTQRMAYSIKSQAGSPSTLLNASGATNFIFEIETPDSRYSIEELNQPETAKKRVMAVKSKGLKLKFIGNSNLQFKQNMELIDYAFPELISTLIEKHYSSDVSSLSNLVESFDETIPLPISGVIMRKDAAKYKIKHFLAAVALGMTPSREWNGSLSANGGYLIVKSNGDIVCYHIFNMDNFKDYLFTSTKLEKGSESRHGYGKFYLKNRKILINLNLQIRFTN